jgi:Protein of unknown function DUF262/Protein of unknown function (DUF1524)
VWKATASTIVAVSGGSAVELGQGSTRDVLTGDRQYRIPLYQRGYSWQRPDWQTLWLDVLTQYRLVKTAYAQSPEPDIRNELLIPIAKHYLGALVQANPSAVGITKVNVVDGQQRLSTVAVMLAAIRDTWRRKLDREGLESASISTLASRMSRAYLTNEGYDDPDDARVLLQEEDQRALGVICDPSRPTVRIDIPGLGLARGESDLLLRAYNYFFAEMNRRTPSANSHSARFRDLYPLDPEMLEIAVADRIYLITIEVGTQDDVNAIFESLNTKGRDLQQVDLLKNYLFLALGSAANVVISDDWQPIERDFLDPHELEHFVWARTVASGENVLQKRTYETIQRELPANEPSRVTDFVRELHNTAPFFQRLLHPEVETHDSTRSALIDLNAAGGVTAIPLAFYAYRRKMAEGLAEEELTGVLSAIESFLVRRMLCGLPTNNLNSMFGIMLSKLKQPAFAPTTSLTDDVRRLLVSRPLDYPTDDDVRSKIASVDFYHQQKTPQRILILRKLDRALTDTGVVPDYGNSDRSIEHIAPQNRLASEWIAAIDAEVWAQIQDQYLHVLGNLALLSPGANSQLGDAGWATKRTGYANSGYALTEDIADSFRDTSQWSVEEILRRSEQIADLAIEIWPRDHVAPHVDDEISSPEADSEDGEVDDDLLDPELHAIQQYEAQLDQEHSG